MWIDHSPKKRIRKGEMKVNARSHGNVRTLYVSARAADALGRPQLIGLKYNPQDNKVGIVPSETDGYRAHYSGAPGKDGSSGGFVISIGGFLKRFGIDLHEDYELEEEGTEEEPVLTFPVS